MFMTVCSLLTLLLVVGVWILDTYVFLLAARLVLQHMPTPWASRVNLHLGAFTDPILQPAQRLLRRCWPAMPTWITACTVLLTFLLGKLVLIRLLVSLGGSDVKL
jgi:hypothetical protein